MVVALIRLLGEHIRPEFKIHDLVCRVCCIVTAIWHFIWVSS